MRLVVLTSGFPYPTDAGRKVVLAGFIDFATASLNPENVILVCVSSRHEERAAASLAPCRVVFFSPASAIRRAALVAFGSLLTRRRAIQEMLVAGRGVASGIGAIFDSFDPDIILVDTIRMVQHLPSARRRAGRRTVLYLDDLYSLRYRRMVAALEAHPDTAVDLIGNFDRFLPGPVRGLMRSPRIQRRLLRLESTLLERRETAMPKQFDQVILLNADEARRLARATDANNVSVVMPLLRRTGAEGAPVRRFTGDPTFLFLGNLRYPANAHGLRVFLRRVMPMFLARVPAGRLIVVGTGAGRDLRCLGERLGRGVSFLDYVEDLDALCSSIAGMVVPLLFGSGVKIKVIEALARAVPMISTGLGIDGLGLEPGRHCIVEDDLAGFAEAMVRLLDPAANAALARQSFACYRERFAPEVVTRAYRAALFGDPAPDEEFNRRSRPRASPGARNSGRGIPARNYEEP